MTENFDSVRYRRRYLVETRFSVLKRKFGADLKSCIFQIQKKEISCKIILANLDRFLQFHICEVFYRAVFFNRKNISVKNILRYGKKCEIQGVWFIFCSRRETQPSAGYTVVGTGDSGIPGHIMQGADVSRGIPAVIHNCWRGAATDNRHISFADLDGYVLESGLRPEPLSIPFIFDDLRKKDLNLIFSVIGKRSAIIQIGIQFMYLDEKGTYLPPPNSADYIKVKKDDKEMYFIRYHEEKPIMQDVFGEGDKQVLIDFVELPHDHEIDEAVGKHYVTFRIAEIISGQPDYVMDGGVQKPAKIQWLWESEPLEFTIAAKNA